ncbi:HesA/MoeB/ThiF family protein [Parashewanella curva]|uniref:HesA/MoeB/ThiF family protein n=1 Tax=Parashewanella curva TaxID=2338552 RepID=A0A3L8Q2E0_9GAMM|nr:HesA/MoeB/ThiF family protein [Parashewanella curva]RLV61189.1 HesA/MoeB/ThiF family protein [Parashewanella curva]
MITDNDFMRYSRQILLPEVGEQGQLKINKASVVIIGVGGLGALVAHYLIAAGVGKIHLFDGDNVELSNLPRQLLFADEDIGQNKAETVADKLWTQYEKCEINVTNKHFDKQTLQEIDDTASVVIDCCDNFTARRSINQFCVEQEIALVSVAVANFNLQAMVYQPNVSGCYQCLYPESTQTAENCSTVGVLGPMVGIAASMQALLALKQILGLPNISGKLWHFDGINFNWFAAVLERDPECPVCSIIKCEEDSV